MNDGWERARRFTEQHQSPSNSLFVRLTEDGDRIVGVFLGEPFAHEVVWTGSRYEAFDPDAPAHRDVRKTLRVALNFYVLEERALKVIEGGVQWFRDVLKVREKYGLGAWSFEIQRQGQSGDPKTTYTILPDSQLSEVQRGELAQLEFHDLERIAAGNARKSDTNTVSPPRDEPISMKDAEEIMVQLKQLPRTEVNPFLHRLGVARIRDIRASQLGEARAELKRLHDNQLLKETPF